MKITGKDAYTLVLKGYPDIMNIDEMCAVLNISTKTGYRLIREGLISCMKVGRTYRIPKVHLMKYLRIMNSGAKM